MAEIILSEAGAALGNALLPGSVTLLGAEITGAALGRTLGTLAGGAIDRALFAPSVEGPRLSALHVMESREGAGIPAVYGRARVGGQVIWAGRFRETRSDSGGGKGGPQITRYSYTVSLAIALGEGTILRLERAWANGEPLDLSSLSHRVYSGDETQLPDPLIEAEEGAGNAPAYRGTAYLVLEDLPLERFGNRIPQLSFEVTRAPGAGGTGGLAAQVRAVNLIPASGEFAYATQVIRTRQFPGTERAINANAEAGRADVLVSLDQMQADLPNVSEVALTVGWFGDDLRAGHCSIRPGVETPTKTTVPWGWQAGGVGRAGARLVSGAAQGAPAYGGTPADRSVVQLIGELKDRGLAVTLSPFLFMDIPAGNGLPDPLGGDEQPAFPWRGRIKTTAAADTPAEIAAFMGSAAPSDFAIDGEIVAYSGPAGDWGYRRFVLHLAWLAKAAGGVSAFLLGSELIGLTRARDTVGSYPFVEALRALAADVRSILGPETALSYAADWTEYGAHVPDNAPQDVTFPLDPLWADPLIDFVGIDWYPPVGDWRDGAVHLDALAGYAGPDDPAYLAASMIGGEGWDWYYASEADRDAQVRTPIADTAHGEDWVFRVKDIAGWSGHPHHPRTAGVRVPQPTDWQPGLKPVRLMEIGYPAVERGGNAPNLFFDPKSSESALPPYSGGQRDDVFQRRALKAALAHYQDRPEIDAAFVWCWDARPYPVFPARTEVWSDGANWSRGHWLNGRTGLIELADVVSDLCVRGGVEGIEASALDGVVEGYALAGVSSLREALAPLAAGHGFEAMEQGGAIAFRHAGTGPVTRLQRDELLEPGAGITESLLDKAPGRLSLAFADIDRDQQPGLVEARVPGADVRQQAQVSLPLSLAASRAEAVAAWLLDRARRDGEATLGLSLKRLELEAGDRVEIEGDPRTWQIAALSDGPARALRLQPDTPALGLARAITPPGPGPGPLTYPEPDLLVMDAPVLPGAGDDLRPVIAVASDPWPGQVRVSAGPDADNRRLRATALAPAVTGRLMAPLRAGPLGRWDRANAIEAELPGAILSSRSPLAVLNGANLMLVETSGGWELLAFAEAALISGAGWRLSRLLRGLGGSDPAITTGAEIGARCVLVDDALIRAEVDRGEIGLDLDWVAERQSAGAVLTLLDRQGRPWSVAHLHAVPRGDGGWRLDWVRRGRDIADSWSYPEADNTGRFRVETSVGGFYGSPQTVDAPMADIPAGTLLARVAEIGADGRLGPWVTIRP